MIWRSRCCCRRCWYGRAWGWRHLRAPFAFIGGLSYPLYVIHFPLAALIIEAGSRAGAPLGVIVTAAFAIPLLVAAMLERWYDKPLRHRLKRG